MSNNKRQDVANPKKPQYDAAGNRINQYIPNYIANKPWYFQSESNTVDSNARYDLIKDASTATEVQDRLAHQRLNPDSEIVPNNLPRIGEGIEDEFEVIKPQLGNEETDKHSYKRKYDSSSSSGRLKFKKKGACENCGSTKHSKRDCFEKPRKVNYKYRDEEQEGKRHASKSNEEEIYVKKDTDNWDVKRDRWHGYDSVNDYDKHLKEYKQKEEEAKAKLQKEREALAELEGLDEDELEEMEELGLLDEIKAKIKRYEDEKNDISINMPKLEDSKLSVRSLDEKPRYLEVIKTGKELNYNPKSRIYKDSSEGYYNDRGQFVRHLTGEAKEFEKLKKFAWEHNEAVKKDYLSKAEDDDSKKMTDLGFSTEVSPTGIYMAMKEKETQEALLRKAKKQELLEKYGGETSNGLVVSSLVGKDNGVASAGQEAEEKDEEEEEEEESIIPQGDSTYYEYTAKGEIKSKSQKDLELIEKYRSS